MGKEKCFKVKFLTGGGYNVIAQDHDCGGTVIFGESFDKRFLVGKCSKCKKNLILKKEESKPADK